MTEPFQIIAQIVWSTHPVCSQLSTKITLEEWTKYDGWNSSFWILQEFGANILKELSRLDGMKHSLLDTIMVIITSVLFCR